MKLVFGASVHCADGPFGELVDVAIEPRRRRVTHLVVAPRHQRDRARLVPIDDVTVAEGDIGIGCTLRDAERFPVVEDFAFLRLGEHLPGDPRWDVGIEVIHAMPEMGWPGMGPEPMVFNQSFGITYDHIPRGDVEIRRTSPVTSIDGEHLGHVEGLLVDSDGGVSYMLLGRGHLWAKHETPIPLSAIVRIEMDAVTIALTKAEVARLPDLPVRSPAADAPRAGSHQKGLSPPHPDGPANPDTVSRRRNRKVQSKDVR